MPRIDFNAYEVKAKIAELEHSIRGLKRALGANERRSGGGSGGGANTSARARRAAGRPRLGKEITGRLLLLTVLWQVLNVGLLTLFDMYINSDQSVFDKENVYYSLGMFMMVACQLVHLAIMVASTVKLAKQLLHHTATSSFLFQSYLSTIVLYAGIYTLLHRYKPDAWHGTESEGPLDHDDYVIKSFVIFLYYSTATITSTGYGDVYPNTWYLYLLCCTEMLLGVLYAAGIFSRGIDLLINRAIDRKETRVLSKKWWHWPRRALSLNPRRTSSASSSASASSLDVGARGVPTSIQEEPLGVNDDDDDDGGGAVDLNGSESEDAALLNV